MGWRGALLLPIPASLRQASWDQFIGLLILHVALRLVADFARVGPDGEFVISGIPAALFSMPLILIGAWCLAHFAGRPADTLLLATAIAAVSFVLNLAQELLQFAIEFGWATIAGQIAGNYLYFGMLVWYLVAIGGLAYRLLDVPRPRLAIAYVACLLSIGLPLLYVERDATLWQAAPDYQAEARRQEAMAALLEEDVFYRQPFMLEQQLAALKPQRPGVIDLYFVGMAGFAEEDVFMKEINSVASLFEERFGTAGRAVRLINNAKTVGEVPIASVTGLERALEHIGDIIDPAEDILFLYLTSHGTQDHRFTLEFGAMQFHELDPPRLRQLLDSAGIRRRVVVISACYSGGFLDALKDENTMVITAAAADRASFGCSNEHDFTYFGRAYFDEALRRTESFITAFDLAAPVIAEREQAEGYENSAPQIFIGKNIRAALAKLEQQQRRPPSVLRPATTLRLNK